MAEFGEDGSRLPPLNLGDTAVPSDEAAGKTHCEVSVLNGDCGISENMVGSGSHVAPGSQAGVESANTSVVSDAKNEIPRRSSIIKVSLKVKVSVFMPFILVSIRVLEVTMQNPTLIVFFFQ